jgi:proton-translocating NADH-quinone oxidoreductase chain N
MPISIQIATAAFIVVPFLAILLLNLMKKEAAGKMALWTGITVSGLQIAFAIIAFIVLWQNNKDFVNFSVFWDLNSSPTASYFSLDFLSLMVVFCIGMVTMVSYFVAGKTSKGKNLNFTNLMLVLTLGMNGIVMVTDLFSFYVFLEITAVASFVLISLFKDKNGLEGAYKYLIMSCIATVFLLFSMAFIFMETGSLSYEALASAFAGWKAGGYPFHMIAALILFATGISIKAGLVPFHAWLPDAYQAAPPAVSVVLGGLVTKVVGVYAIMRLMGDAFGQVDTLNSVMMVIALVSIVFGAIAAVGQKDFKRILAYSSISQIGYIVLGISCGSFIGFLGAALHFFNHSTFKTTLFVNSAAVEHETHTRDISRLGGLSKQMPITGASSVLAFLSAAGIPPLAGFWSKLLIIIATWQTGYHSAAFIAIFASIFTLAYFLRLQRRVFFGPQVVYNAIWPMNYTRYKSDLDDNDKPIEVDIDIAEPKNGLIFSQIFLSVITVAVGVLFPFMLVFLQAQGIL